MPIMSDTHILIGRKLRAGVDQCNKEKAEVDLSEFTLSEIRHKMVAAMLNEFRPLYTFQLDDATRVVTVKWNPAAYETTQHRRPDALTAQLTHRRC
jgi:hypothetical protein